MSPAVSAFDGVAAEFDQRYSAGLSVQAQRRAVRRQLLAAFPPGALVLELGGGTGDDACFLAERGRRVLYTDGAPQMVRRTEQRVRDRGVGGLVESEVATLEGLDDFATRRRAGGAAPFDGAFSNFAALNCVDDLGPVGRALARLLRPGAHALLVVFGPCSVGEILVQMLRGDPAAALRRFRSGAVPARVRNREFVVRYPSPRAIAGTLRPWFRLKRVRGIGVFVPPSAAEPTISRYPRLVRILEALDRVATAPLALGADHVLLDFERTSVSSP
jgi:SAM-dependent methyltransferase